MCACFKFKKLTEYLICMNTENRQTPVNFCLSAATKI